jgi:hypothetical protein
MNHNVDGIDGKIVFLDDFSTLKGHVAHGVICDTGTVAGIKNPFVPGCESFQPDFQIFGILSGW